MRFRHVLYGEYPVSEVATRPLLIAALLAHNALAEPVDSGSDEDKSARPPTHYINFRAGFASTTTDQATLCIEVRANDSPSLESCGSGRGLFRGSPGRDMVHLRMNVPIAQFRGLGG